MVKYACTKINTNTKMKKGVEDFFIFLAAVVAIYVVLVVIRMFHFYNLDKTNEQVAKIHNTKLTMDDVGEESPAGSWRSKPIKPLPN